jgi:deoxyadenosine/deoxycytidine kinase
MPPTEYIIVTGNIGTGKTTSVQHANLLLNNSVAFYEERDIYLSRFYSNPVKYAFLNQLAYSLQYLNHAALISKYDEVVIQDRSIYDTHEVFSKMRLNDGMISNEEFLLLKRIYDASTLIVQPTLMVMLDASVEVTYKRFLARAHQQEVGLTKGLLEELKDVYRTWYTEFDVCKKILINTDNIAPLMVAESIVKTINK